jgi:sulfatase maturation enzyme AslB (radical SAM superfamily)
MIHGGLYLNVEDSVTWVEACCLRPNDYEIDPKKPFWPIQQMADLRDRNLRGQWDSGCDACRYPENTGMLSMRQGMNRGLGIFGQRDLSGPARIDIQFDISCNLACRTCGPHASSFWQHHLRSVGESNLPIKISRGSSQVIQALSTLDLSHLRQVVFCGGETLLGQEYWDIARWITQHTPRADQNLTLCFQTNGTQGISDKNFDVIQGCKLVKLQVSIDGIGPKFQYLRWPASWSSVCANLLDLRSRLPGNVMFLVEQTISIFNVLDLDDVDHWVEETFNLHSHWDRVDCTRHLAQGIFNISNASEELMHKLHHRSLDSLLPSQWREDPASISHMISEIKKFDHYRQQSFQQTFPEVWQCFRRFW